MNKQELIERIEDFPCEASLVTEMIRINKNTLLRWVKELDEPQSIKLKDVIKRMEGLSEHTRSEWLDDILYKFGEEFGSKKYRDGYEQGKFEGEWVGQQLKDADKIRKELNKPVVPQFVADWIEECKNDDFHLFGAMEGISSNQKKLDYWFREDDNMEIFARAWLDGYEVEKEKRYRVKMKGVNDSYCVLTHYEDGNRWIMGTITNNYISCKLHTKKQLEDAGFGWVFDCKGIEVKEVKE